MLSAAQAQERVNSPRSRHEKAPDDAGAFQLLI
jgi:hypothetical protein